MAHGERCLSGEGVASQDPVTKCHRQRAGIKENRKQAYCLLALEVKVWSRTRREKLCLSSLVKALMFVFHCSQECLSMDALVSNDSVGTGMLHG